MKRNFLAMLMLLLLPIGFAGCSSDDESIKEELVKETELPTWMIEHIQHQYGLVIIQGNYNGNVVYGFFSEFSSVDLPISVFDKDGNPLDELVPRFKSDVKNMKRIYVHKLV